MTMPRPEGADQFIGAGSGGVGAGVQGGGAAAAGTPPKRLVPELAELDGTDDTEASDETTPGPTMNTEPDPGADDR
jgi:hypothetical protein